MSNVADHRAQSRARETRRRDRVPAPPALMCGLDQIGACRSLDARPPLSQKNKIRHRLGTRRRMERAGMDDEATLIAPCREWVRRVHPAMDRRRAISSKLGN